MNRISEGIQELNKAIQHNLDDGIPIERQTLLVPDAPIELPGLPAGLKVMKSRYVDSAYLIRDLPLQVFGITQAYEYCRILSEGSKAKRMDLLYVRQLRSR